MKFFIYALVLIFSFAYSALPNVSVRPWGVVDTDSDQIKFRVFHLKSIGADAFLAELKSAKILDSNAKYALDKQTNSLMISAGEQSLDLAAKWLNSVDKPAQQISIRARIVYIDNNQLQHLGITFNQATKDAAESAGQFQIPVLRLHAALAIDAQLDLLKQEGYAKIVASPELVTTNNSIASISSGDEIPYQEKTSMGSTSATFKKAVMSLAVTPHILSKNNLRLDIKLNQDQVSKALVNGVPLISTRSLSTVVRMQNNQTVVLGGIVQTRLEKNKSGIPVLSDIPVLGYLFGRHRDEQQKQTLWIILTPHIISSKSK
jgi:type II secretory pathway component HofQ